MPDLAMMRCDSCSCMLADYVSLRERAISGTSAKDCGWLIETRPTLGAGEVVVTRCFPCRQLTIDPLETGLLA